MRSPQETLIYWIAERERIRLAKERGEPKPWSDDPVFQTTYFCNVRREDDRVTRWIRENWSPQKIGWEDYEYAMVLARMLNWPPTLERITYAIPDPETIYGIIDGMAGEGKKVWGNAYVVTTHGLKMDKISYLCDRILPAAYEALGAGRWRAHYQGTPNTLAHHHERLMGLEGLASFMAAQVIADLKNTPSHPLYEAKDWGYWSAPGPGSLRGLSWFFGERITEGKYRAAMAEVRSYLLNYGPNAYDRLCSHGLFNMQDLQNCLCEYDKYMRVSTRSGRSKRGYPGR